MLFTRGQLHVRVMPGFRVEAHPPSHLPAVSAYLLGTLSCLEGDATLVVVDMSTCNPLHFQCSWLPAADYSA
jgi:hypothetical protein